MPVFIHLRALVFANVKQPKPTMFVQLRFPLNAEQMQEIQGLSSGAHCHLNADMLYSSFLLVIHLPALLVTAAERLTQKFCTSRNDSHC